MLRPLQTFAVAAAVLAAVGAPASAEDILNTGFETGTYNSTGLTDFSSITSPFLIEGAGVGDSVALDFGSDGASVGPLITIGEATRFTMMGRYNGSAGTSSGTLSFGWSQATGAFNPFTGTGPGVSATDHILVGVARAAGNAFRLAYGNGASGALNNFFGNSVASLTTNNWYRLEGSILYNSTTKIFTFEDISFDDFGATGSTEVTADLLAGTGATLSAPTFDLMAQPIFINNRDRGFQFMDNFTVVPEPTTAGLAGLGAVCLLARRRRG